MPIVYWLQWNRMEGLDLKVEHFEIFKRAIDQKSDTRSTLYQKSELLYVSKQLTFTSELYE